MAATAVVTEFRLRPMEAGDGPAMARLLREEAQTTRISLTTTYQHDVVTSLLAQHPTLFGVVAEVPGDDRLAGMATAFMQVSIASRLGHGASCRAMHRYALPALSGRV